MRNFNHGKGAGTDGTAGKMFKRVLKEWLCTLDNMSTLLDPILRKYIFRQDGSLFRDLAFLTGCFLHVKVISSIFQHKLIALFHIFFSFS